MFRYLTALALIVLAGVTKDATWAVAAGLYELAGVLYAVTQPIRLKEVKTDGNANRSY